MSFLHKIQNLPESKKKFILWTLIIIISLILLIFWVQNVQKTLRTFPKEEFKEKMKSPFEEKLKEMPKLEIPEISEEELKTLEEELKEQSHEEK